MSEPNKFWDKIAERYSKRPVADEESYQRKLQVTRNYFRPDMEVLEFGCGTGSTAIVHAPNVKQIHAIDISARLKANAGNDYFINRSHQKDNIYTGITGTHLQDQAITESMGGIVDHEFEHPAPSDRMITQTRRRLLNAVKAHQESETLPPGIKIPEVFLGARSGHFVTDAALNWRDAYAEQRRLLANPTGKLPQAAE